jgi:hypothetical protein
MANDNDAFLQVLGECTEVCAGMDLSDNRWRPPDGRYDVELVSTDQRTGIGKTSKRPYASLSVNFRIVDGEHEDRQFQDFFYIEAGETEPTSNMKNICRLATCLAGSTIDAPIDAAAIIAESEGTFLTVECTSGIGKKTGKQWFGTTYLSTLESTEDTGDDEADEDVEEADDADAESEPEPTPPPPPARKPGRPRKNA